MLGEAHTSLASAFLSRSQSGSSPSLRTESAPHPLTSIVTAVMPCAALTQLSDVVHIGRERAASAVALLDGRLVDERVDLRERVLGFGHVGGCEVWLAASSKPNRAVKLVEAVVELKVESERRLSE